ncbi:MAG: indole-3-glycerol phosphate synthase TrpC [Granulosicoccus sp.]
MAVDVPDILKKIIARKREEITEAQRHTSVAQLQNRIHTADACRGFARAISTRLMAGSPAVIAEIKKASPSKGVLRDPFIPADVARSYESAGAACLSVLTDTDFFQGGEWALKEARAACALPVIRKDFIVDPYQVYEARAMNADCVLLIAGVLSQAELSDLYGQAVSLGMDVLVEVHDAEELERAQSVNPMLLGINNRDLRTFNVSLTTTECLLPSVADGTIVVTESGIMSPADVMRMRSKGVHAFLVGEAFMRADDPGAALSHLFAD